MSWWFLRWEFREFGEWAGIVLPFFNCWDLPSRVGIEITSMWRDVGHVVFGQRLGIHSCFAEGSRYQSLLIVGDLLVI